MASKGDVVNLKSSATFTDDHNVVDAGNHTVVANPKKGEAQELGTLTVAQANYAIEKGWARPVEAPEPEDGGGDDGKGGQGGGANT